MINDLRHSPAKATGAFFLVTLLLAFSLGLMIAASSRGLVKVKFPETLAVLIIATPTFAAVLLVIIVQGWSGFHDLFTPILSWRISVQWYFAAIFLPAMLNLSTIALYCILGGASPAILESVPSEFNQLSTESTSLTVIFLTLYFFLASLVEEIGWRGYALPRLQSRLSALSSSLIIGIIWAFWHVPLMFLLPGTTQGGIPFLWYIPSVIAISVVFTWLYNNAGGSLLLVTIFHASIQINNIVFPILPSGTVDTQPYILSVLVTIGLAVSLILISGPQDLSRIQDRIDNE